MKKVTEQIPEYLTTKDEILEKFLELMDDGYEKLYDEILKMTTYVKTGSLPDDLLDYLLFENGVAVYEGYTAAQKRSLLNNIVEIDSKRYTVHGLRLFVDSILPNFYADVEVPYRLNEISFRNPAIGFPNSGMRLTAGREQGDINSYIPNRNYNDTITVILFAPTATEEAEYNDSDFFDFLDTVIRTELPDLIPGLVFSILKYKTGVDPITVSGTTITGTVNTTFSTDFSAGDYIGLYSTSLDQVLAFQIDTVVDNDTIELVSSADTSDIEQGPTTVTFYEPI